VSDLGQAGDSHAPDLRIGVIEKIPQSLRGTQGAQSNSRPQANVFGAVPLQSQDQCRDGIIALYGFQSSSGPFANHMVGIIEHRPAERLYSFWAAYLSQYPGGFVSQIRELTLLQSSGYIFHGLLSQVNQGPCCFLALKIVVACTELLDQSGGYVHGWFHGCDSFKLCRLHGLQAHRKDPPP